MIPGFVYLENSDPYPALGSAAFLSTAPAKGMQSKLTLNRLYYKGAPSIDEISRMPMLGDRIQLGNEPNNPVENYGGSPCDYLRLLLDCKRTFPAKKWYWAGPSPSIPGWQQWYRNAGDVADGIAAHAYGTFEQMADTVYEIEELSRGTGCPIWVAECNFGAGQRVDVNQWSHELKLFLDWCQGQGIEAVSYFAYKWPSPDMQLPTPVDAAGTMIERVIREWRAS